MYVSRLCYTRIILQLLYALVMLISNVDFVISNIRRLHKNIGRILNIL